MDTIKDFCSTLDRYYSSHILLPMMYMLISLFTGLALGYWLPIRQKTHKKIWEKGFNRRFFIGSTLCLPITFLTGWILAFYVGGIIAIETLGQWSTPLFMGLTMFIWVYIGTLTIGYISTIGTSRTVN